MVPPRCDPVRAFAGGGQFASDGGSPAAGFLSSNGTHTEAAGGSFITFQDKGQGGTVVVVGVRRHVDLGWSGCLCSGRHRCKVAFHSLARFRLRRKQRDQLGQWRIRHSTRWGPAPPHLCPITPAGIP
jgi:hypothetical protein